MALILPFVLHSSGRPFNVDPLDIVIASIAPPPPLEESDPNAFTSFTLTSTGPGVVYRVQGAWDVVRAMIAAYIALATAIATINNTKSEDYTPTLVASGGGVVTMVRQFSSIAVRDALVGQTNVIVRGSFDFAPAVVGVLETVSFTLPTLSPPPVNFAAANQAAGSTTMQGLHPATDIAAPVIATVGAKTAEADLTSTPVSCTVEVCFSYSIP